MLGKTRRVRWIATFAMLCIVWAMPALAATGRPWLGVMTQAVDDDLRRGLDIGSDGALINSVVDDSPAGRAGLRKGDVILRFDSRRVTSPEALTELVGRSDIGRAVRVEVLRDGASRAFSIRIGERPDEQTLERTWSREDEQSGDAQGDRRIVIRKRSGDSGQDGDRLRHRIEIEKRDTGDGEPDVKIRGLKDGKPMSPDELEDLELHLDGIKDLKRLKGLKGLQGLEGLEGLEGMPHMMMLGSGRGRLGVRIESVDDDLASALGLSAAGGALVTEVLDDTPAMRAELRKGDVITAVDGRSVRDADALRDALGDKEGTVSLTVVRRGTRRTVQAKLEPRSETRQFSWKGDGPDSMGGMRSKLQERHRLAPEADRDGAARSDELKELREEIRELRRQLEDLKNR